MVKVSDLGYQSKNLEQLPSKEQQKDNDRIRALRNLTSTPPPERLSLVSLPESLLRKE